MSRDQKTAAGPSLSFTGLVRSETIKARGLRTVRRLMVAAVILPVGTAAITAAVGKKDVQSPVEAAQAALSAVSDLSWMPLLVVMLLGTVVATSEYEHGALQTTFAVVPRRTGVVLAKVTVVAVSVLVAMLASVVLAFFAAAVVFGHGAVGTIGEVEVVRVLVGTALYAAAAAVIAMSIGLVVRSSIAGIAVTIGFLYILPSLLQALSVPALTTIALTLPGPASTPLDVPGRFPGEPTFLAALVAVLAWTAATVAVSSLVLRRRDV